VTPPTLPDKALLWHGQLSVMIAVIAWSTCLCYHYCPYYR